MSAKFSMRQVGDVTVIDGVGRITLEVAGAFRETIHELAAKGQKRLLLNLAEVRHIDSSGIGELVSGFTTITNQGGQLKLLHLSKRVKDVLTVVKLLTVFEVFDDEAEAIRSFG